MAMLIYGATTIGLPDELQWTDEYAWQAVLQRADYSVTGALLVESALKLAGQPMTIAGTDESGWITRETLDALTAASRIAGQSCTLVYRTVAHTVVFDHENGAVSAKWVVDYADPISTDYYVPTLKFLKV